MHERENALKEWLVSILNNKDFIVTPLCGDASFRRYFRLKFKEETQIVMDAPPGKEDLHPFIYIAEQLARAGVLAPHILAQNIEQGFLLLSDLGDRLLLNELNATSATGYYQSAIAILQDMQQITLDKVTIPAFDKAFMIKEMSLCPEWFFHAYLSLELNPSESQVIQQTIHWIAGEVAKQPLVFIHRDYHSRNLMVLPDESLGVIDFQDAMAGPITYDLVSLLKDCYISWPREQIIGWLNYFYQTNQGVQSYTFDELIRAFDLCGLQRHLKVLGVFCRLFLRDGKAGYLKDLPLTLNYVLECCETYPELHEFYELFQKRVVLP